MAKILITDDEPEIRSALAKILREGGHESEEAYDGLNALEVIKEYKPDLMLLDWMLPELHGGEVADKIRNDEEFAEFRDIPIIIVSDFEDEASIKRFSQCGANGHVPKRDNTDELKAALLPQIELLLG